MERGIMKDKFTLRDCLIQAITMNKNKKIYAPPQGEMEVQTQIDVKATLTETPPDDLNKCLVLADYNFQQEIKEITINKGVVQISVTVRVIYEFDPSEKDDIKAHSDEVRNYLYTEGLSVAFPYWRMEIIHLMAMAGLSPIPIPPRLDETEMNDAAVSSMENTEE